MSIISDAMNNARRKINNVYSALEVKGATMPEIRDLDHMVTTVEDLIEFHSTYKDWEYNGNNGYINLVNYIGSSPTVKVPYTNYTNLTNSTFQGKQGIVDVDCRNVPFLSVQSAFQSDYNLQYAHNIEVADNVTSAQSMFYDCRELRSAHVSLPSSCTVATKMFTNCKECTEITLDAPGLTTLTNTFALMDGAPRQVILTSPNITGTTNTWRGYQASGGLVSEKSIFMYYRYSNGTYTPTFNSHKAAQYMGTTGNATTSYITPRYNSTSMFYLYDITNTGGLSTEDNRFIIFKDYSLGYADFKNSVKYIGSPTPSSSISIPGTMHYKKYPDINDTESVPVVNMVRTFYNYTDFNQDVQIPSSVTNMVETFSDCHNLQKTVHILSENVTNATGCFSSDSRPNYCTVYIPFRYSNGVDTRTFNSFVRASYLYLNGTSTGHHKTKIYDLNA